jgi:FkbH-like protein
MIDCKKIKLVIWDLDDTFWRGTLSEGEVYPVEENCELVKELSRRGIVNAVCSKNDYAPTMAKLKKMGVADYFVFPSIDWTPKGGRIAKMIKNMGLRAVSCLFLDDNVVNLNEAQFYSEDLMVAGPSAVAELAEYVKSTEPSDADLKRLKQYRVLETKQKAKEKAGDNMAFLYASNTRVELHEDCEEVADRLFELVHRTNQLNFTKNRCSREEFDALLADADAHCGYATVKDNFGDYGIVGFYAVKNNHCEHFLFSCRTIGQGVEQWVYSTLGCPELKTVEPVVNHVEKITPPQLDQPANFERWRVCA